MMMPHLLHSNPDKISSTSRIPVYRARISECCTKFSTCSIEVLNVKVTLFILILFVSLPDCGQNQTAVSDEQYSLSDF
jgi:hypothetical protein